MSRRQIETDGARLGRGVYLSRAEVPDLLTRCRAWASVLPEGAAFGLQTAAALLGAFVDPPDVGHLDPERLDRADGLRGVVRARFCAPRLTPLAMSRPESLVRCWILDSPLPAPEPQMPVENPSSATPWPPPTATWSNASRGSTWPGRHCWWPGWRAP